MLSMPSTISSAVSVTSAAQAFGSVEKFEHAFGHSVSGCRSSPAAEEVERDGTQSGRDPRPGHHVAPQRDRRQHAPRRQAAPRVSSAQPRARGTDARTEPAGTSAAASSAIAAAAIHGSGLQQQQIERRHVPHRRKAEEIVVRRSSSACRRNRARPLMMIATAQRDREIGRQQAARHHDVGRNEHVGEEIDHEIEHVAGPARQRAPRRRAAARTMPSTPSTNSATPSSRNISAQLRSIAASSANSASAAPEAVKMCTAERQRVRERRSAFTGGSCITLPQSSRTSSAERPAKFQLRPKARTREVSARAMVTSRPTQ